MLLKADRSPVTVADFAVQALVAHRLGQAFPDDPLVAEEDSASLQLPDARPTLQSVLDVLHRAVPDLPADQVLEAIDRGRGTPGQRFWTLDPSMARRGSFAAISTWWRWRSSWADAWRSGCLAVQNSHWAMDGEMLSVNRLCRPESRSVRRVARRRRVRAASRLLLS